MKFSTSRWPAVLLMLLLAGGLAALLFFAPPTAERSLLPFSAIDCGAVPGYVPADFLSQVQRQSHLPDLIDTRLPASLAQLQAAVERHPWVEQVDRVQLVSSRRIHVQLRFREPLAVVRTERQHWAVDGHGVLLPPLSEADLAKLLPILGIQDRPHVSPGQVWPAVQAAAAIAALLRQDRTHFQLAALVLHPDPLQPTIQVRTKAGSSILWRNQSAAQEQAQAVEKLRLLREYVLQYGSLDAPDGPYQFDVRRPQEGLLRQKLGP